MTRFARRCWLLFLVCALVLLALAPGATLAAPPTDTAPSSVNTWATTGAMAAARFSHTATLLPTGQVLVAGGCVVSPDSLCGATENSAELYDPQSGTWTSTGAMAIPRFGHTATLLPTGKVLVTGGSCNSFPYCLTVSYHPIAGAELYDPASGTWSFAARMHDARYLHTATLLPNGKVLVAGGYGASGSPLATAELYDPRTGIWTRTGSMSVARWQHTATLLPNGKVLVTGGNSSSSSSSFLASAELYDPRTGTWTTTGIMSTPRAGHTATLLANGQVLVAGGQSCSVACYLSTTSAELYNPSTGVWTPTGSMATARAFHTATLLPNGMVLAAGGCSTTPTNVFCLASASAEAYNPRLGLWSPTASLATARSNQTATLLPNGRVLVAGGINCFFNGAAECPVLSSAELYTPGPGPLVHLSATSLDFGNQAVAASSAPQTVTVTNTGTLPLYVSGVTLGSADPQDYTAATTCTLALVWPGRSCVIAVRFAPTAVGSRTASLSIADNAVTSSRQVSLTGYATGANGWVATGSLTTARAGPTATLLPNGQVLIAGGFSDCNGRFGASCITYSSAELYDPGTGTFTPTGSMTTERAGQTATLLSDGEVLIAGGSDENNDILASAELYDPATGTFTPTGSMSTARTGQTATLLPDGKVLVAGGVDASLAAIASAEVYDPATGTWTPTGTMATPRVGHTATLLPNGMVLVTGGDSGWPDYTIDSSAELYNPSTGTWTAAGSMAAPRVSHTATLLSDGQVLIAGGCSEYPQVFGCTIKQASAELYDPTTGIFTATGSMATARDEHTAMLLSNGTVLVAGGDIGTASPSAEVYNPHTGAWSATGAMLVPAPDATATLLANGNVLVAGGGTQQGCGLYCIETGIAAAELYTP